MLTIEIPSREYINTETYEFKTIKGRTIQLEHSLISLSKWEAKWKKAFLKKDPERTPEQALDYIRCMTITQNVDPEVYRNITPKLSEQINEYINDPMSATHLGSFGNDKSVLNRDTITSELIYYWMIALQIPFECQKWHLNRLLKLIEVCNAKNESPKPMTKSQKIAQAARWRSLNASRKARLNSKG